MSERSIEHAASAQEDRKRRRALHLRSEGWTITQIARSMGGICKRKVALWLGLEWKEKVKRPDRHARLDVTNLPPRGKVCVGYRRAHKWNLERTQCELCGMTRPDFLLTQASDATRKLEATKLKQMVMKGGAV